MTGLEPHAVPEDVDPSGWRLGVGGSVARTLSLDRADLAALPTETFEADFACVEGWTASDLTWRGVRLGTLLDRAQPTAAATHALVRAMDGEYACTFPIERLATAVLAIELDGERLPLEHGGPARLVPTDADADCWESIKWVAEIEIHESEPVEADTAADLALSRIE